MNTITEAEMKRELSALPASPEVRAEKIRHLHNLANNSITLLGK